MTRIGTLKELFFLLAAVLVIWGGTPSQAAVITGDLCFEATSRAERRNNIPKHLLKAIALAETGRWDKKEREKVAWPWTVTSGGAGMYFPSKQAAITKVRQLIARGVSNIDVGCMQINMYYHPDAFVSLDQAFDPTANVAYGAKFLTEIFESANSWTQAAAYYHSRTPERAERYKKKVLMLWEEEIQNSRNRKADTGSVAAVNRPAPIDRQRMAYLNASFKARRAAAEAIGLTGKSAVRRNQLDAWRTSLVKGISSEHEALMRRVRSKLKKSPWKPPWKPLDPDQFESRRRMQLEAWRNSR